LAQSRKAAYVKGDSARGMMMTGSLLQMVLGRMVIGLRPMVQALCFAVLAVMALSP